MVELDLKKLAAPDFAASLRPGMPALVVLNEDAVPKTYWEPGEPRLRRQILASDLKGGAEVEGATVDLHHWPDLFAPTIAQRTAIQSGPFC